MILDLIGNAEGFSFWTRMTDTGEPLQTPEDRLSERPRELMLTMTFADGSENEHVWSDDHVVRQAILERWAELDCL